MDYLAHFKGLTTPIGLARTLLFVPGHHPDRFSKALASGADAVILDLEDAVPQDAKTLSRETIESAWPGFSEAVRARLLVRINPAGTALQLDDLKLLTRLPGLGGIVVPKVQAQTELYPLVTVCPGAELVPLIETAEGIAAIDDVAHGPKVCRLGFGHIDLQADLGMSCSADETELAFARWALVVASRRAGLAAPVDGVTVATTDEAAIIRDTSRSRRHGFSGKLCIHPAQVAPIHAALAPSDRERDWASRILDAEAAAGGGAFSVDGKMVDAPVLLLARQMTWRMAQV